MKNNLLIAIAGILFGCGEGRSTPSTPQLTGVVRYEGALVGALQVSVFDSFPPRGSPIATQRIDRPVFPQAYAFQDLAPGRYFVLAIVDRDPEDGDRYHPATDPGGAHGLFVSPRSVTVGLAQRTSDVDVTIVDPSSDSPWIRRGYR